MLEGWRLPQSLRVPAQSVGPANSRAHCDKEDGRSCANLVHNPRMSLPEQQTPPIEERIGSMVGKIIVLALCAMLLWGYSTTFLAQIGLM